MKRKSALAMSVICLIMTVLTAFAFAACSFGGSTSGGGTEQPPVEQPGGNEEQPGPIEKHECEHVCPYCKKCTDESCTNQACANKCECEPVEVTHTQTKMLAGTIWENAVHKFVTNKPGPKIAIVGGIHGDEVAGWTAGLQLVNDFESMYGICGEILLIPQCNIVADTLKNRYPNSPNAKSGVASYNGVSYSDLNRSFNNGRATEAQEATIRISDAITAEVEAFDPDYIIDLHESLHSWKQQDTTTKSLGDTLIYTNEPIFMEDLIYYYNNVYLEKGETKFASNPASTRGSFNYYFTNKYDDKVVFTIETNRGYSSGTDNIPVATRVRQQLNILNALFDIVWERVDVSPILG